MNAQHELKRLTIDELVTALQGHVGGLPAGELFRALEQKDYDAPEIQRTIQRALNAGAIHLGSKLRLFARETKAAA